MMKSWYSRSAIYELVKQSQVDSIAETIYKGIPDF